MKNRQDILTTLNAFGHDNLITRAGDYWSADNAVFEQNNPTLLGRVGRAINPMTGFGSAMGAMKDAASQGSATQAGLALLQALPLFGAMRSVASPAQGAIKASIRNTADLQRFLINGGASTTASVGVDEAQAQKKSHD